MHINVAYAILLAIPLMAIALKSRRSAALVPVRVRSRNHR